VMLMGKVALPNPQRTHNMRFQPTAFGARTRG